MYNYDYLIPEKRQEWRSASEIKLAALKHEERRIQLFGEKMALGQTNRKTGFLSFLAAPLRMLAALMG